MVLGLFEQSEAEKRAAEVRAGTVAPTRSERQKCWVARDAYFACLDKNNIIDALKDEKAAAKACKAESTEFEKDCAAQWVSTQLLCFGTTFFEHSTLGEECDGQGFGEEEEKEEEREESKRDQSSGWMALECEGR